MILWLTWLRHDDGALVVPCIKWTPKEAVSGRPPTLWMGVFPELLTRPTLRGRDTLFFDKAKAEPLFMALGR